MAVKQPGEALEIILDKDQSAQFRALTAPENGIDFATASVAELREELVRQMSFTAAHLVRLATIVAELERRGEDLSDLRIGMMRYLRLIALGQLVPEVVIRFADSPLLLNKILTLPLSDQARLAQGEPVKMIVYRDGKLDHLMVDPLKLVSDQVRMVFGPGVIKDEAAQILWLEQQNMRQNAGAKKKTGRVRCDGSLLFVGKFSASMDEVLEAIADARGGKESNDERTVQIATTVTEAEEKLLGHKAVDSGISKSELMRRTLRAMGVI
jgi:hypothetical protein